MREVTEVEFFRVIGPQDVHPRPEGRYPYTSIFEDKRTRTEAGRIVNSLPDGRSFPVETHYYLPS